VGVAVAIIGALMPRAHVASRTVRLGASPQRVYDTIADVSRYPEWRNDVTRVEVISTSPLRWKEHGSSGVITYVLRRQAPSTALVAAIDDESLPFDGTWTYDLSPDGAGTALTITEHGEVKNPVFRFISRTFFSPTATMDRFLAALGRRLTVP
jgi:ribosome-associated toxin RatA of RatAB toxin-antitoxin module